MRKQHVTQAGICLLLSCFGTSVGMPQTDVYATSPELDPIHSFSPSVKLPQVAMGATVEQLQEAMSDSEIDVVLNAVAGVEPGPIIRPFQPQRRLLWRRWHGTVLRETLPAVVFNMVATFFLNIGIRRITGGTWAFGLKPDTSTHVLIARLDVFANVWRYLMSITTFTLTWFVGEAFGLWKDIYMSGRRIQGRMNDIGLLLATHAARDKYGNYTPQARWLLDDVGQYLRLFHLFLWASSSRQYRVVLTQRGLERMKQRGMITQEQIDTLSSLHVPPTQYHAVCLEWVMMRIRRGLQKRHGDLIGDAGLEMMLLEKCCTLRGTYGTIGDRLDGRMPLAYAHMVQILVDCYLFCAPFALYTELGIFSVFCVGILTLFYSGLLDLAKVFLDPLDNEDYCQDSVKIDLGVLVRESNASSRRWKYGAESIPEGLKS